MIASVLLLAATEALAEVRASSTEEDRVVAVARVPGVTSGNAFLGWDDKSRVFLLDANTLTVYPVEPAGLGEPEPLELIADPPRFVASAAMGDDADDWVLHGGQNRLLRFESGKQTPIQLPEWFVTSVAYFDGKPSAFVLPAGMGHDLELDFGQPWLVVEDDSSWEIELSAEVGEDLSMGLMAAESPMNLMRGHFQATTSPARSGGLWVADTYQHRLRHLSRSGQVKDTITVGLLGVEFMGFSAAEKAHFLEATKAQGKDIPQHVVNSGRLKKAIEAISEARDGKLYVLVSDDSLASDRPEPRGDLALDRFDPVLLEYDRVELTFPEVADGRWDMAPSRDGLYLLSYEGGLWFVSWESLETAEWARVEGAELDGQPLAPPR